jgi:hypothetical protein
MTEKEVQLLGFEKEIYDEWFDDKANLLSWKGDPDAIIKLEDVF